jgi:hypothetical protein
MAGFESGYKAGAAGAIKGSLGLEMASVGKEYQTLQTKQKQLDAAYKKGREEYFAKVQTTTGEKIDEIEFNPSGIENVDSTVDTLNTKFNQGMEMLNWSFKNNKITESEATRGANALTRDYTRFAEWYGGVSENIGEITKMTTEGTGSRLNDFKLTAANHLSKGIGFDFNREGFSTVMNNGQRMSMSGMQAITQGTEETDLLKLVDDVTKGIGGIENLRNGMIYTDYFREKNFNPAVKAVVNGLGLQESLDLALQLGVLENKGDTLEGSNLKFEFEDIINEDKREQLQAPLEKALEDYIIGDVTLKTSAKLPTGEEKVPEITLPPMRLTDSHVYASGQKPDVKYGQGGLFMDLVGPLSTLTDREMNLVDIDSSGNLTAGGSELVDSLTSIDADQKVELATANPDLFTYRIKDVDENGKAQDVEFKKRKGLKVSAYGLSFGKSKDLGIQSSSKNEWAGLSGIVVSEYEQTVSTPGQVGRQKVYQFRLKGSVTTSKSSSNVIVTGSGDAATKDVRYSEAKMETPNGVSNVMNDDELMKVISIARKENPELETAFQKQSDIYKNQYSVDQLDSNALRTVFAKTLSSFN